MSAAKLRQLSKDQAIPFVNADGHVIRLSRSMKLSELLKIGVVNIHITKPKTPLAPGEWRDMSV